MGKMNSGPASSLLFEYDANLIGDNRFDTEYADPENSEHIWEEGRLRVNTARWLDTELGFNHPERPLQLEVFNGKEIKRFQADISFAMKATEDDVQEVVDEIIMDQF